ncbi:hypothetical protein QCE73_25090 [Caballeronia sp. LZ029]|uniref:hypothetical protein n=1 Tax=Caballeronia sp. LZ029 TaxID=3038564 RepID=UPI00285777A1|nr:hypothetical protein [Caballeronia sp. LZ029]MDR5746450.1 hypothetical protein [Caballeronia sp. LZ029]
MKSLHAYYTASENDVTNYQLFSQQLEGIRNTKSQNQFQRKAASLLLRAMILSGIAAIVAALGTVAMMVKQHGWGVPLIVGSFGLFLFAEARFGRTALSAAKEQDRRYFLECLRSARACNELDWAGLFTYGAQSTEDLTEQLRNALYNDEYRQYSHARQQEHRALS